MPKHDASPKGHAVLLGLGYTTNEVKRAPFTQPAQCRDVVVIFRVMLWDVLCKKVYIRNVGRGAFCSCTMLGAEVVKKAASTLV